MKGGEKVRFWQFKNINDEEAELRISGEIASDDDTWIMEFLGVDYITPNAFREELAQYKGKNLTVWIDSWGGDVFAAAGIYNALKEHKGKVTVKVDGKAVSAASIIAMAGDEVLMSPVSMMMIHNPLTGAYGEAKDLRKAADVLDEVKEAIINAYQLKTGLSRNKISRLMDEVTWMNAKKAVAEGFADGILYSENIEDSNVPVEVNNAYSFSVFSIQNSASAAMRRFFNAWKQAYGQTDCSNDERKEETVLEIQSLEDLKKHFPELCNQLVEEAKNEERNRIKEIDEISATIDSKLVVKAKYETPMTAQELAFEALKADAKRGQEYLEQRKQEFNDSGAADVQAGVNEIKDEGKEDVNSLADKIASYVNQKRNKGSVKENGQ